MINIPCTCKDLLDDCKSCYQRSYFDISMCGNVYYKVEAEFPWFKKVADYFERLESLPSQQAVLGTLGSRLDSIVIGTSECLRVLIGEILRLNLVIRNLEAKQQIASVDEEKSRVEFVRIHRCPTCDKNKEP